MKQYNAAILRLFQPIIADSSLENNAAIQYSSDILKLSHREALEE